MASEPFLRQGSYSASLKNETVQYETLEAVDCMKRLASGILVLFLLLAILMVWKADVPPVNAASTIYQGNLILTGNNVTTIQGRFDINGSIIVRGNATLILNNAVVNFTQKNQYEYNMTFENPANGNPRLACNNSTITSEKLFNFEFFQNSSATISNSTLGNSANLKLHDTSVASVTNSSIWNFYLQDPAVASILNSTVSCLEPGQYAKATVTNSTIQTMANLAVYVNCSLVNIRPGFVNYWDFQTNASIIVGSDPLNQGWASNVSLVNTSVNSWQFHFHWHSNATISDSAIYYLSSSLVSTLWTINTVVNYPIQCDNEGKVYVSWYMNIHVTDSTGQNVPSANVTATFPNSTIADRKTTNSTGWARLTLTEKMINETGQYPVGNYTVKAEYGAYSNTISANMTGNKEATLQLPTLVIPEFPTSHALALMATLTLMGALVHRKRHLSKKKL